MSQCKIYLENYNGTYYAGSEIRGRLECYFHDDTKIRGIKVRIKCKEHNEWSDTEEYLDTTDNKYKTRYVTYTGYNQILNLEQMVCGAAGTANQTLPVGKRVYPFSFTLPTNIPSSFNGPYGSIVYDLKGIVDRPMRTDYEDVFIFGVVSPIDFNLLPDELQNPVNISDDKTVCCWCCTGGNLTMDVELRREAFVPGESIPLKVTVTNLSNESVEELKVELSQIVKCRVDSPSIKWKENSDKLVNLCEHGVGAHGEHTYNLSLDLPDYIQVPNFAGCSLFEASHSLQVTCVMGSCTSNLDIWIYPKLGHIQRNSHSGPQPPNNQSTNGYPPFMDYGSMVGPPQLPSMPYPPPPGGSYPTPPSDGSYPPPVAGFYAPSNTNGNGSGKPPPYPPQSNFNYPNVAPSAPSLGVSEPGRSDELDPLVNHPKAQEAANSQPTAPPELRSFEMRFA